MPCYHPLDAWRGSISPASGKARLVFKRPDGKFEAELQVPCGRCIGCRLEYSRQWAVRCMHEASMHEDNCFVTLTYRDECLPYGGSLVKSDLQKFQKRLNKYCTSLGILAPRYFQCGEYGERFDRPHYHACLFGFDFPDRTLFKESEGTRLYTSEILASLWPFGHSTVGDCTFESAAYVARYVTKKINGDLSEDHYVRIDEHGECFRVDPEFCTMSRGGRGTRGGIGRGWFERWRNEVYPSDEVVVRGYPTKPPRYYDDLCAKDKLELFQQVRCKRNERAEAREGEGTPERLRAREKVRKARMRFLKRAYEDGSSTE